MKRAKLISYLKLVFCVFVICFVQLLIGCSYVFSSTLLAQLREPTSTLKLSMDEASWIASISVLVCPVGLIITGILTDKIGRKKAILIIYLPMILSWLILAFANSYRAILIARIILGFPFGSSTVEYLYIAEISPVNARPIFFSTVTVFVCCGILTEWILAMFFHWNAIAAILCGLSVVGLVATLLLPESPMWLRAQGRDDEADRVDRWFGLKAAGCADVPAQAPRSTAAASDGDEPKATAMTAAAYWSLYAHRTVWKPALITSAFLSLQQWSGVYVLLFYSVDVFRECRVQADGVTVSAFLALARLLGGVVFAFLYRLRRRTLMVVSGTCTAASLSVVVAYAMAFDGVDSPPYGLVPVLAFLLFMFFNLLGILPLPWILCGEVFPMAVKGTLSGAVQTWGYFVMFLVIKMYPMMVSSFGVEIVWSIFAACCVVNVFFGVFVMPETRGKSLDQILWYFETGKKS